MFVPALIVIAAAAAAFFYPDYQASLPLQITMDVKEAHLMGVYLLALGLIFVWLSRPRRRPAQPKAPPPAPTAKS